MHSLASLEIQPTPRGGLVEVRIADARTGQTLVVEHDGDLAAYDLERADWPDEPHPDAVLIGELDGESSVLFVELKGRWDERAFGQIEGGARHFHPAQGSHGERHHRRWASNDDRIRLLPPGNHRVAGLCVVNRAGARPLPTRRFSMYRTQVPLRLVQLASVRNEARTTFRGLFAQVWPRGHTK